MIGDGGGGPLTTGQFLFFLAILYGPTLLCTIVYALITRSARTSDGRTIGAADHVNALFALIFTVAAPFLVLNSVRLPITHALTVVLIPGLISSAILAWQWKSHRHGVIMALVTLTIACVSFAIDPQTLGPKTSEPSMGIFLIEPVSWLIGYGFVSGFASAGYGARLMAQLTNCLRCGYSLEGLAGDICPECGRSNSHSADAAT